MHLVPAAKLPRDRIQAQPDRLAEEVPELVDGGRLRQSHRGLQDQNRDRRRDRSRILHQDGGGFGGFVRGAVLAVLAVGRDGRPRVPARAATAAFGAARFAGISNESSQPAPPFPAV